MKEDKEELERDFAAVVAPIVRWRRELAAQEAMFDAYLEAEKRGEVPLGGGLALQSSVEPTAEEWERFLEVFGEST